MVGQMKSDGRLTRNVLKIAFGNAPHAVMHGAGHNIRPLLNTLRLSCVRLGIDLPTMMGVLRGQHWSHRLEGV